MLYAQSASAVVSGRSNERPNSACEPARAAVSFKVEDWSLYERMVGGCNLINSVFSQALSSLLCQCHSTYSRPGCDQDSLFTPDYPIFGHVRTPFPPSYNYVLGSDFVRNMWPLPPPFNLTLPPFPPPPTGSYFHETVPDRSGASCICTNAACIDRLLPA